MVNFRFHIVSLVAIFLALALGVVIGAGVIDRGLVDTLDNRLNTVESKADRIQLENDILNAAINRDNATVEALQPYVLVGRLTGEQVAFVAVRGVDDKRVTASVTAARQAGATVTGVLWIESKWGKAGDDAKALATAVGEPTLRSTRLRTAAWEKLAERLARPPLPSDTSPDLLTVLQTSGFVGYDEVDGGLPVTTFPGKNALFVLVIGEAGDVPSENVVMPAATAFSNANLDLTIGDVYADLELGPARGDVFNALRDSELSRTISTVDDLDLAQGPLTVMLAVSDLTCTPPVVGHYGYGPDTRPLPDFATACRGLVTSATAR
jgi:Copper transport outer membrane protein, MctB